MTTPLVECIPNFSEARRPEVIEAIMQTIAEIPDVSILDRHSDIDHNRSVVTFVGPPDAVEEAAFRAIQKAADLIDLNQHTGTHPRIGATDVVPFVPISGVTMEDCVAIARRLGKRVGRELNIPVYLYEEAATRPEHERLENIRRGQYEGLKAEIGVKPDRKPNFGPKRLSACGATVIGARHPLIAFNVYLDTDNITIAESIAKKIRASSGGLAYVKALGMLVGGKAQVSMNLTNFHKTPIHQVVERIHREASRHKTSIHHSELVGLIPQEALIDTATWYLHLDGFQPDQILEQRLYRTESSPQTNLESMAFLDKLAADSPSPGGGSAAAYVGAMSAALVAMVARLTIGKKKYTEVESQMTEILKQAERLRRELSDAVLEDSSTFGNVFTAFKLPKKTKKQESNRAKAIEKATLHAARIPLSVAQKVIKVMALAERVVALGNLNAITDGASAAALARAALTCASYNVRINIANLSEKTSGDNLLAQLATLEEHAFRLEKETYKSLNERGGISLA